MNPLVPTPAEGALMIAAVIGIVLALIALVAVLRSAQLSGWRLLAWAVVVLAVPFVGALTWFVTAQHGSTARSGQGTDATG